MKNIKKFEEFHINESKKTKRKRKVKDSFKKHKKDNLKTYPDIDATASGKQNPKWHPNVNYSTVGNSVKKFQDWAKKAKKSAFVQSDLKSWDG